MGLIKCRECNKDISEHAKQCPRCGHEVEHSFLCKECGAIIDKDVDYCSKCGCPRSKQENATIAEIVLSKTKRDKKYIKQRSGKGKSYRKLLIVAAIIIVLVTVGAITYYNHNKQATPEEYISIVQETAQKIMDLTDLVYESNGLITEAWLKEDDDLIYETGIDSYRDSAFLTELFDNNIDFREDIRTIKREEREIARMMETLPECPSIYKNVEIELRTLYSDLIYLVKVVTMPEGTMDNCIKTELRLHDEMEYLYNDLQKLF